MGRDTMLFYELELCFCRTQSGINSLQSVAKNIFALKFEKYPLFNMLITFFAIFLLQYMLVYWAPMTITRCAKRYKIKCLFSMHSVYKNIYWTLTCTAPYYHTKDSFPQDIFERSAECLNVSMGWVSNNILYDYLFLHF